MGCGRNLEVITIGNELLTGRTSDRHLLYIGRQLSNYGVHIQRSVVVTDDAKAIEREILESLRQADIVLTTGGLGPTSDDCTREAIARAVGVELVHDDETAKLLAAYFKRVNRPMTPNNLKQARKPAGAETLPNHNGTAPGLWLEHEGKILIVLPGPPEELHPMFENAVLPRLKNLGLLDDENPVVELRTAGVGESMLETTLDPVLAKYPGLDVGYRAQNAIVDFRISSSNGEYSREDLEKIAEECAETLGEDFVGFGCHTLSRIISEKLRQREQVLAVAESCTGGLLASCFTDIPGASKTFAGGVVTYTNAAKVQLLEIPECLLRQHGAVSPEAAVAMATAVAERLSSEYALSLTGFAGPDGGDRDNPVGTIHIGLHTPEGVWSRRVNFQGNRTSVKNRAVNAALDWLRRELAKPTPALSTT